LQISNSGDGGYDFSGSQRISQLSLANSISASLLTYTALNITESGENFITTKKISPPRLYPTDYFIKSQNINLRSQNTRFIQQVNTSDIVLRSLLYTKPTTGYLFYTDQIFGAQTNRTVYYDGTQWNDLDLSQISVSSAETCSAIIGTLGISSGGTGRSALRNNSILIGNGTNQVDSSSLSYPGEGYVIISDGTSWKTFRPENIKLITDTSSYADFRYREGTIFVTKHPNNPYIDFQRWQTYGAISSVTQSIIKTPVVTLGKNYDIVLSSSVINVINSNYEINFGITPRQSQKPENINFKSNLTITGSNFSNFSHLVGNATINLNANFNTRQSLQGQTNKITLTKAKHGQIVTISPIHPNTNYISASISCSSDTKFAAPEYRTVGGIFSTSSMQFRYDAINNQWFRHF
jgi:hypothetical protein